MKPWTYPAKLLLFGEYAVLDGGEGLACSWPSRGARWVPPGEAEPRDAEGPDTRREQLRAFLDALDERGGLTAESGIDTVAVRADLDAGWWLAGNVPAGYGLGSSGVAVAALVDRYADWSDRGSRALQRGFADLEAPFHGQSSGLDPLVSYLGRRSGEPVWLRYGSGRLPELVRPKRPEVPTWSLYLLDSGQPRRTAPLVEAFGRRRSTEHGYAAALQRRLLPANADAIEAFVAGAAGPFGVALHDLSAASLDLLAPMIPEDQRAAWAAGLEERPLASPYLLKLCGAGGGGYACCWTANPEEARAALHSLVPVLRW